MRSCTTMTTMMAMGTSMIFMLFNKKGGEMHLEDLNN